MIDIIANIASILGFTMQMNDKFFAHGMNKEQADNEMLLLFTEAIVRQIQSNKRDTSEVSFVE